MGYYDDPDPKCGVCNGHGRFVNEDVQQRPPGLPEGFCDVMRDAFNNWFDMKNKQFEDSVELSEAIEEFAKITKGN